MHVVCSIRADAGGVDMAECDSQLSASQEACQAELHEVESMCGASGQEEEAQAGQQVGHSLQEEDWHEVLYKVHMGMTHSIHWTHVLCTLLQHCNTLSD